MYPEDLPNCGCPDPVTPIPTAPAPPACVGGEPCAESINTTCVRYDGPDVPGVVENGQSMTEVFQQVVLATQGPQGPQGVQGPTGVPGPAGPAGLTWRGTWVSGTSYVLNDAVGYNGASYFCILATSGTTAPNLATSNWALLASQGAIGPQGAQGPQGPQGPQGLQGPSGSSAAATQGTVTGGPDYNLAGIFSYDFNTVNPVTGSNRYLLPSNPTIGKIVTVLNYSATVAATIKSFTQGADFIGNYNNSYTSTTGVKAGETIRFIYVGNGYWKIDYVASQNIFFNNFQLSSALFGTGQNGIDYRIVETTVNTTTTALSAATLNTNYPDGANPNGLKIYCPNISGGGLVYIKTGASTWVSTPITAVV